jgi:hypothetical protein
MVDLKANYQGSHSKLECDLCGKHLDDQESLLSCEKLAGSSRLVANLPQYSDLFCEDVGKQLVISSILEEKFKMRNKAIDKIKKTNEKS